MEIAYILIGLVLGGIISYLWAKQKFGRQDNNSEEIASQKLKIQTLETKLEGEAERFVAATKEIESSKNILQVKEIELRDINVNLAQVKTRLEQTLTELNKQKETIESLTVEKENLTENLSASKISVSKAQILNESILGEATALKERLKKQEEELDTRNAKLETLNTQLAQEKATNSALAEKLAIQKKEIDELGKKFQLEFENIANKILEEKTEKFTDVNKTSLEAILKPLGENIDKFKKQVEESYNNEAKERFSLGEQVKEMAKLNKIMSEEARTLTKALKGEAKTQGNWGEMILESILEKSGLRKGEEYFLEHQLVDKDGKPLRSDEDNKKMRPDAVIKYPDNRSVIIDSKVSLNAFTRYLAATDKEEQERELNLHVSAIKNHIISLSTKGYDDFDKALDFVLMFVPSEPAYIAAMQGDSNLWNYAYDKRILLMNPTNLITALKLIVDLWKREYQNQNAIEIANRGAKLYDKFVGFVKNLEAVGTYIDKAQGKYGEAYKQLSTGNDNLVLQATKLKNLGIKNKKELPQDLQNKEEA